MADIFKQSYAIPDGETDLKLPPIRSKLVTVGVAAALLAGPARFVYVHEQAFKQLLAASPITHPAELFSTIESLDREPNGSFSPDKNGLLVHSLIYGVEGSPIVNHLMKAELTLMYESGFSSGDMASHTYLVLDENGQVHPGILIRSSTAFAGALNRGDIIDGVEFIFSPSRDLTFSNSILGPEYTVNITKMPSEITNALPWRSTFVLSPGKRRRSE